ncbi:MAG: glycosyltransferase family 9 protein [Pseudomonadota bacterium]
MNTDKITDVIWIQTAFLGDIILSTAAFSGLKTISPSINQHLITTPIGKAALKDHPALANIIGWDKRKGFFDIWKQVRFLRSRLNRKSTLILQPHRSARSSILSRILGFQVITYTETKLAPLKTVKVPRISLLHESHRVSLLLEPLGISRELSVGWLPNLNPLPMSPQMAQKISSSNKIIAIAPGSVWATKRWTESGFRSLIEIIQRETTYNMVLLGSGDDARLADEILAGLADKKRILNLVNQTSLDELRMLYPKLSALISGDSSPIHYGSAFQTPTVMIYGATHPALGFYSRSERSEIVEMKDLICRPCSEHGPKSCPLGHFQCMRSITGRQVFDALMRVI